MPIPSPGVPSAVTPISSVELKTTLNNRAFYINSGLIDVDNTETTVISVDDVGKRDILICITPAIGNDSNDKMFWYLYNNGALIYQYCNPRGEWTGSPLHFIIPANTSIEISMKNIDATAHSVGMSCYGYYLDVV